MSSLSLPQAQAEAEAEVGAEGKRGKERLTSAGTSMEGSSLA